MAAGTDRAGSRQPRGGSHDHRPGALCRAGNATLAPPLERNHLRVPENAARHTLVTSLAHRRKPDPVARDLSVGPIVTPALHAVADAMDLPHQVADGRARRMLDGRVRVVDKAHARGMRASAEVRVAARC